MTGNIDYFDAMLIVDPSAKGGSNDNSDYSCLYRTDGLPIPPQADLEAAWAAYVPPIVWTPEEFWARFTEGEQISLVTAENGGSPGAVTCRLLRLQLSLSRGVRSDSPKLAAAMSRLVGFGRLTAARAAAILDPRV
jgi:hypothetical protein